MNLLNKIRSNRTLLNGALFSAFSFINKGFMFLLLLVLANYISPAEYGYLSLFSTIVVLTGFIICLSSEGYITVSFFQEGQEGVRRSFSVIFFTGITITSLLLLIIMLGGKYLADILELSGQILIIAVLISFFTALVNVNLDYFRIQERVTIYGFLSCGNALLNFIVTIFLIKYLSMSWEGRAFAQLGCSLVFGTIGLYYFYKKNLITLDVKKYVTPILIWSLPLIPLHVTNFIRQGVDRYIINYHHTIADVGIFSFAINIANAITMIGFGFNQSFSVDIYKILGCESLTNEEKLIKLKKLTRYILLLFLTATIIITIVCYFFVPILLPNYALSINFFIILSVYAFFVCYYLTFTNILYFYKNTGSIMYWSVGSSVLHILLSFLLTRYSLYLTSMLYCFSQSLFAIGIQWQANRELKKRLLV